LAQGFAVFFSVHTLNSKTMLYSCVIALALASYDPVDTQIIVKKDDYSKYDNCDDPGNCAAPCASPQIFHSRMCDSWMCTMCPSDWCKESCAKLQEEYPTCRCHDWPDHKMTYSASDIPDVVLPTCKEGDLVGCHTIHAYYYAFMTACPEKLSFGEAFNYYYYDYARTYYQAYYDPETGENVIYQYYDYYFYSSSSVEQAYYATLYTEGQAHDGFITYSGSQGGNPVGPVGPNTETIHMKFECDENPGGSYITQQLGAENMVAGMYYSDDGSYVYKVAGKCAC